MPTIEEILTARGSDQLSLLLRWLPESDVEALALLGEGLSQNLARHSRSITAERFWALFLQRWLTLDSEAALAFAKRTQEAGKRFNYQAILGEERLYAWWAQVDAEAALVSAKTQSMSLAVKTLNGLAAADPARALAFANPLPREVAASLDWSTLFKNLAKQDPAGALEAAKDLANPLARDQALQECLKRLGQDDPKHALSQLDAISSFTAKEATRESIMESWFDTVVASAVRVLEDLKPSLGKVKLTRSATLVWAKKDPDAAQTWAASQQSPSLKRAAFSGLAITFAGTDIERAKEAFRQLDWDLTDVDTTKVRQTELSGFTSLGKDEVSLDAAASQWITAVAATDRRKAKTSRHLQIWPPTTID